MTPEEHYRPRDCLHADAMQDIFDLWEAESTAASIVTSMPARAAAIQVLRELWQEGTIAFFVHVPANKETTEDGLLVQSGYGAAIRIAPEDVEDTLANPAHWLVERYVDDPHVVFYTTRDTR